MTQQDRDRERAKQIIDNHDDFKPGAIDAIATALAEARAEGARMQREADMGWLCVRVASHVEAAFERRPLVTDTTDERSPA